MVGALMATAAAAQPPVLTLDQALKTAQERQPQLKEAAANTVAAQARADQARASLLPQLRFNTGFSRSNANPITGAFGPTGATTDFWSASLTANQLVWDFGQTWNRWNAAGASAEAQAQSERATRTQVAFSVRTAYFAARAQKSLVTVALETLANQERHLAQIQGFVRVGTRPEIDLAQARTDVANARVQRADAESNYDLARAQLNQAMGVVGSLDYDVAEEGAPEVEGEAGDVAKLFARAEAARPEVAAATQRLRAEELAAASVWARYWPSLGLSANTSEAYRNQGLTWSWSAGASLNWPLFEGLRTNAEVREARAQVVAVAAQLEQVQQAVRLDVDQARLAVRAAKAALAAAADAVVSAQERLRLAEGRYQAGVGNSLELGDSQLAVTATRAQQVQADYRLAGARAQLLRALGQM
jgi:outer membrane protein